MFVLISHTYTWLLLCLGHPSQLNINVIYHARITLQSTTLLLGYQSLRYYLVRAILQQRRIQIKFQGIPDLHPHVTRGLNQYIYCVDCIITWGINIIFIICIATSLAMCSIPEVYCTYSQTSFSYNLFDSSFYLYTMIVILYHMKEALIYLALPPRQLGNGYCM